MKSIKEIIAEKVALPKDVALDLPRISVCGDKEIFIENHKGIAEYTSECIRIKANDGIINVFGSDLRIIILRTDRMVINGELVRVEYEKNREKNKKC